MSKRRISTSKINDAVSTESNSFALFGDDSLYSCIRDTNRKTCDAVKKNKDDRISESAGSQSAYEEPKQSEHNVQKCGHKAKRGFRSLEINKIHTHTESCSDHVERQCCTKNDGENGIIGKEQLNATAKGKGTEHKSGRVKREVQKGKGGGGVYERCNSSTETIIDTSKLKYKDFDDSNKIQNGFISGSPRQIKDTNLVEAIIDGYKRKVSSWSIRDGQYIQGLDSNFLVKHYKVGKR